MQGYLARFSKSLAEWKGSLVKVGYLEQPNAKEYLHQLARAGVVERVSWGWYWVPAKVKDFWDFLGKDRNFKVIAGQTAASFWNHDFVHREVYLVKVRDSSYGKALEAFGKTRGWKVVAEPLGGEKYTEVDGVYVEALEDCVIECMQHWAFADAFAVLYENRRKPLYDSLARRSYWKRITKSEVRIRQALSYGCCQLNELSGERIFPVRKTGLEDAFVSRAIDEAVGKVVALG
jgi:predicted transcriptional regulator of viral defense system